MASRGPTPRNLFLNPINMGKHLYTRCVNSLVERNCRRWEQAGGLSSVRNGKAPYSDYDPELNQPLGETRSKITAALEPNNDSKADENPSNPVQEDNNNSPSPLAEQLETIKSSLTMEALIAQKMAAYQKTLTAAGPKKEQ